MQVNDYFDGYTKQVYKNGFLTVRQKQSTQKYENEYNFLYFYSYINNKSVLKAKNKIVGMY